MVKLIIRLLTSGTKAIFLTSGQSFSGRDRFVIPKLECLEDRVVLDDTSAGINGVNARNLTSVGGAALNGNMIGIGQVEVGRPGLPGFDNPANSHPDVVPQAVFRMDGPAFADQDTSTMQVPDGHGTQVAGVMIANGMTNKGIAPAAKLYSSATTFVLGDTTEGYFRNDVISMQQVATQNPTAIDPGGDVRAINLSYVDNFGIQYEGTSTVTLGLETVAE